MCYTNQMVPINIYDKDSGSPELHLIDAISGKWTVLIIYMLSEKTMRHSELQRAVGGISQKVLTQSLRNLERNGIVRRKVYPVVPPQVEYSLTPLGKTAVKTLSELCMWAKDHYAEAETARKQYDTHLPASQLIK